MNDDPLLDLFAVDLLDLTSCAPDLSQAIDVYVGDSFNAAALTLARPVAGGAPDWWDDVRNFLEPLWEGPAGWAEKLGKTLTKLWDTIWSWVGGTVRWLYNWAGGIVDWLQRQLLALFNWLWNTVSSAIDWTRTSIWNRIGDVSGWVWGAIYWVRDRVWEAAGWVKDRLWDVAGWVRDRIVEYTTGLWHNIWDAASWLNKGLWVAVDWVKDRLWEAVNWLKDRMWEAAGWVKDRLWDSANWLKDNILPPIMGGIGDLGDAIGDAFGKVGDVLGDALGTLADKLGDAVRWPWEHIMEPFGDIVERKIAIPGKLLDGRYHDLRDLIDDVIDPPIPVFLGIVGAIILGLVIAMITTAITTILVAPLCEPHVQATQARVGAQLLTVGVIQEALNRGFIDPHTAEDHLSRSGYDGTASKAILDLRFYIPPPTDLIAMAVHEVFNPDLRRELDLDAEYPDVFTGFAAKLGISQEWAENYWANHWRLPSAEQGFEMLHRREIQMPMLERLLKALDYAPVWRQPLTNIAYNPITRVDLRRLYKLEIINEDQVFNGYRNLGYNDERARWLTDFTVKYYNPEDQSQLDDMTDLAVSAFRTAYRRGVLSRDEALDKIIDAGYTEDVADFLLAIDDAQLALNPLTDMGVPVRDLTVPIIRDAYSEKLWTRERAQQELEALGYLAWEADLLLQLEDLAQQRELAELEEAVIKTEYTKRVIDRPTASIRLDALDVQPERRDLLLRRWDAQAGEKTRDLTVAQVQRGLRDGVFTETEVLSRFSGMGYNEADAKFLVDDVDKTLEGTARRLSVSQLSRAYKVGAISDAQLLNGLLGLGYSQEDAQVLIDIATPQPAAKERQLSAAQLSAGFRAGLVTEAELLEKLTALDYAQADAELLRDIAAQRPEPQPRRLSTAQLRAAFKAGLIDQSQLLLELLDLGYAERDATWLQTMMAAQPLEPEARRLSTAQLQAAFKAGLIDSAQLLVELLALGYTQRDAGWLQTIITGG